MDVCNILNFPQMCKMYEDYLEEFVKSSLKFIAKKLVSRWKPSVKEPNITEDQSGEVQQATVNANNDGNTAINRSDISKDTKENVLGEGGDVDISGSNESEDLVQTGMDSKQDITTAAKTSVEAQNEERIDKTDKKEDSSSLSDINFSFTIFILWCIVTTFNIPNVLFWAHNYRYVKGNIYTAIVVLKMQHVCFANSKEFCCSSLQF